MSNSVIILIKKKNILNALNFKTFTIFFLSYCCLSSFAQTSFEKGKAYRFNSLPINVGVADLNNDGFVDILFSTGNDGEYLSENNNKTFVIYQNKEGILDTLNPKIIENKYGLDFKISDMNNDGLLDIISGISDSVCIYFQLNQNENFVKSCLYSGPKNTSIEVGDLDKNGTNDFVFGDSNNIKIFYNKNGAYIDSTYSKTFGFYYQIKIGDVNSDGLEDIVCSNSGASDKSWGGLHVYLQNQSGGFENYIQYYGEYQGQYFENVVIADVNNDGKNEVLTTIERNSPNAAILIWYQDSISKNLLPFEKISAYDMPQTIIVEDLNCNGNKEIILSHNGWTAITVHHPSQETNYSNFDKYLVFVPYHSSSKSVAIGDLNNDNRKDILSVGGYYNSALNILYNKTDIEKLNTIFLDQKIHRETTNSYEIYDTTYYSTEIRDTISEFYTIKKDTFEIIKTEFFNSIKVDSILINSISNCIENFIDTTVYSYQYNSITQERIDTNLISSSFERFSIDFSKNLKFIDSPTIYPNPCSDVLYTKFSDKDLNQEFEISFYTSNGMMIDSKIVKVTQQKIPIDIVKLVPGINYIKFKSEKTIYHLSFIKL